MQQEQWILYTEQGRNQFLAYVDESLQAFVRLKEEEQDVFLGIGVNSVVCNRGIGKAAIIDAISVSLKRFGKKPIRLEIRTFNERAIACYVACGLK